MATYAEGTLVRVSAIFKNAAGADADPTTVALDWHRIGDAVTTWAVQGGQIVKDSVGHYHADLDTTNKPGSWSYEWDGTGVVQVSDFATFLVTAPP